MDFASLDRPVSVSNGLLEMSVEHFAVRSPPVP